MEFGRAPCLIEEARTLLVESGKVSHLNEEGRTVFVELGGVPLHKE